jgi:hypothetical protein
MNARELLANTLSAGLPLPLYRVFRHKQLKYTLPIFVDANTRQDAAQKLENASHDSYVRQNSVLYFQHLLFILRFNVARVHVDALVRSK